MPAVILEVLSVLRQIDNKKNGNNVPIRCSSSRRFDIWHIGLHPTGGSRVSAFEDFENDDNFGGYVMDFEGSKIEIFQDILNIKSGAAAAGATWNDGSFNANVVFDNMATKNLKAQKKPRSSTNAIIYIRTSDANCT